MKYLMIEYVICINNFFVFLNLNYNTRNFDSITLLVRILKRSLDESGNKNFLLRKIEKI